MVFLKSPKSYRQCCIFRFQISPNPFSGPRQGAYTTLPRPLVGWGGDTPPRPSLTLRRRVSMGPRRCGVRRAHQMVNPALGPPRCVAWTTPTCTYARARGWSTPLVAVVGVHRNTDIACHFWRLQRGGLVTGHGQRQSCNYSYYTHSEVITGCGHKRQIASGSLDQRPLCNSGVKWYSLVGIHTSEQSCLLIGLPTARSHQLANTGRYCERPLGGGVRWLTNCCHGIL